VLDPGDLERGDLERGTERHGRAFVKVKPAMLVPSPAGLADLSTSAVLRWCGLAPVGDDRDRAFLHRA